MVQRSRGAVVVDAMWAARDDQIHGRLLALGDSPRSEMLRTEITLHDPAAGTDVVRMLMLSRLLKASSLLWPCATNTP